MPFYIYILHSKNLDGFYIGFTATSPQQRLSKHLTSKKGHTAKAKDWQIVYTEAFQTKQEAMAREKLIKGWKSKEKIKQLIMRSSTQ